MDSVLKRPQLYLKLAKPLFACGLKHSYSLSIYRVHKNKIFVKFMRFINTFKLTIPVLTITCLISCGGGGGGSASSNLSGTTLATKTGSFIDSAVSGIGYTTGTQTGITDSNGNYVYVPGETVTFNIGAITFPPIAALSTVTPLNMSTAGSLSDPVVTNVAYLLQSLDMNNDPDDGIQIDSRVAALAKTSINFNQPTSSFELDTAVVQLITAVDKIKSTPSKMTTSTAAANFGKTLLGLVDQSVIPSLGCDTINTQTVLSRTNYSTNFWASVIVKPTNKNGFVYGGGFRNIGSNPAGAFAWYQPLPGSNEMSIAQSSGQWDPVYSPKYDVWLQHSQNPNIVMRVAVTPMSNETATSPKYVGTAIYLMYVGPVGTYLDFQFESGSVPVAYFSYTGTDQATFFKGTPGMDGLIGDADDGVLPLGMDQIWLQHQPGQANFPPNMHTGGTTPYGRTIGSSECLLTPGGSVQLWGSPSTTADLLFSPNSRQNFWGSDAPLYTDANGYQGAIGLRAGVQFVSVIKSN